MSSSSSSIAETTSSSAAYFGDNYLTIDVHAYNNFICEPLDKAAVAVIEATDVIPKVRFAYQTPGVNGGVSIVVNERVEINKGCLTGPSGWQLMSV